MIWPAIPVLSCSLISYLVHVPTILPASYHSLELSQYKNVECAIVQSILVWISCKHVGQHSYLKRKYFDNKITLDHPGWPSLEKQISPDSREHYCITTTWLDFKLYLTGKMFDLNNKKVNLSNTYQPFNTLEQTNHNWIIKIMKMLQFSCINYIFFIECLMEGTIYTIQFWQVGN